MHCGRLKEYLRVDANYWKACAIPVLISIYFFITLFELRYRQGLGEAEIGHGFFLFLICIVIGLGMLLTLPLFALIKVTKRPLSITFLKIAAGFVCSILPFLAFYLTPGARGSEPFLRGFYDRVEAKCTEAEIREWAEPYLAMEMEEPYMQWIDTHQPENVPDFVKRVLPQSGAFIVRGWLLKREIGKTLTLSWGGSSSGNWGFYIGHPDLEMESTEWFDVVEWRPGIYLFYGE